MAWEANRRRGLEKYAQSLCEKRIWACLGMGTNFRRLNLEYGGVERTHQFVRYRCLLWKLNEVPMLGTQTDAIESWYAGLCPYFNPECNIFINISSVMAVEMYEQLV